MVAGCGFAGCGFAGVDFTGSDLSGARLSGVNLSNAVMDHVVLEGADLRGADLASVRMDGGRCRGVDAAGCRSLPSVMRNCDFRDSDFSGEAHSLRCEWRQCDLTGASFAGVDLGGLRCRFEACKVDRVVFDGASLDLFSAARSTFHDASFRGACVRFNDYLEDCQWVRVDFRETLFVRGLWRGEDLSTCRFDFADLRDASLEGTVLPGLMRGVDLRDSDVGWSAGFDEVSFDGCLLQRAC